MSEYTLTTEDVRIACEMALSGLYPNASRREAFNRWLEQVKAEAWDEAVEEVAIENPFIIAPENPYDWNKE